MNVLSKNILLFIAVLFLSQVQASNFSGVSYFDFSYVDKQGGVFNMTRTHLKYANKLSHNMDYNIVLDVERESDDSSLSVYLSNAELRMQLFVEASISLGLIKMNMFDTQEETWGHRYISKSAMELYNFSASDDFGVGFYYRLGNLNFSALLTNGEGYNSSGIDEFQKYSFQFLYGKSNLKSISKGSAFNVGLALSIENFESMVPRSGVVIDNLEEYNSPTVQDLFSGTRIVTGLFGGFTNESVMAGFEYNMFNTLDSEYTTIDQGDNVPFGDDELAGVYSTYGQMKTSTIISTYFSLGVAPKLSTFFRLDMYDPNIAVDANTDSQTHILIGVQFALSDQINVAPLIKQNILESSDAGTTDLMVNFEFRF